MLFYIRHKKRSELKYILPSVLITAALLILCEMRFVIFGLKNYNPDFLSGVVIQKLALEGWLYYLIMPFSGIMIFEFVYHKWENLTNSKVFIVVSLLLLVLFALISWFFKEKTYTFFIFFLLLVYFGYTIFRNRFMHLLFVFYLTFILFIIPCLIMDFFITGLPIVSYDIQYTLGIQIYRIPVENFGMYFLMLLMAVTIYEFFCERKFF